jgi:hypothetical protein
MTILAPTQNVSAMKPCGGRQAAAARLVLGRAVLTKLMQKVRPWETKHFASQRHKRLL